jgi:hypothetical protein
MVCSLIELEEGSSSVSETRMSGLERELNT